MIIVISVSELCAVRYVGTRAGTGNTTTPELNRQVASVIALVSDHDAQTPLPVVADHTSHVSIF